MPMNTTNTKGALVALSDDIKRARGILARLCENGLVSMSVPVRQEDEDMVLLRIIEAAALQAHSPPAPAVASEREAFIAESMSKGATLGDAEIVAQAMGFAPQPPCDNDHIAPGSERFAEQTASRFDDPQYKAGFDEAMDLFKSVVLRMAEGLE